MGKLVWRDQMAIGIKEIDDDHKALVAHVNEMEELLAAEPLDGSGIANCLLNLIRYTREHFEREERLMNRIDFPAYQEHREQHMRFSSSLYDLGQSFAASPTRKEATRVYDLLADWVVKHLVMADRDIVKHLTQRPHLLRWQPEVEESAPGEDEAFAVTAVGKA